MCRLVTTALLAQREIELSNNMDTYQADTRIVEYGNDKCQIGSCI